MAGVKDGIWKRGNNWYISVKVNGRRRVKSFGRDRKAAELALAEILKHRAVANATNDWSGLAEFTKPKSRKTFSEVAEDYLAERASLKYSTLRGYREVLKNYLLPSFGKMEVSDITEEDVARFQAEVSKDVSAVRTNNIMGLLRYIMKVCLRRKLIRKILPWEFVRSQKSSRTLIRSQMMNWISLCQKSFRTIAPCSLVLHGPEPDPTSCSLCAGKTSISIAVKFESIRAECAAPKICRRQHRVQELCRCCQLSGAH